jgi:hypothetical protein
MSNKTPEMEAALEELGQLLFGHSRQAAGDNQLCVICGTDANFFRDDLSRKEFSISRMCQSCQDQTFGG